MDRIKELISKMTLEEKASLCSGADNWHTKEIKRLNIPSVMMVDGPHGLRKQEGETDHLGLNESVEAVCFPAACATASSFDVDLMERMGETLGAECQAENVSMLLGPAVNIKRSPLCGRNFECLSEDPYLAGRMASAYIRGVQNQGVGTSIKHFALNNQETFRMTISSEVSERALREIYLPAFEKAVKESAPRTVMCSYNKINGEYASENRYLLTDILRKEWGYKGCVVSDWGAVNNRVKGLQAGLDLEMPYSGGYNDRQIVTAVQEGRLDEAVLDEAVERVLHVVFAGEEQHRPEDISDKETDHKKAADIETECAVLLENNGILPLSDKLGTIAVIGPNADSREALTGNYNGTADEYVTFLDGIRERFSGRILYSQGCHLYKDRTQGLAQPGDLYSEALAMAECADVVVACVGLDATLEGEEGDTGNEFSSGDKPDLRLPESQRILLRKLEELGKPLVIVLAAGSSVNVEVKCEALLDMWYPGSAVMYVWQGGMVGGAGTAAVLTGEVSPSGKLPVTFYRTADLLPDIHDYSMKGRTYRYCTDENVLYPFGHGLSYADVRCVNMEIVSGTDVEVTVENRSDIPAEEVVQVYVKGYRADSVPNRSLCGFQRVRLEPHETKTVRVPVPSAAFQTVLSDGSREVLPGRFTLFAGIDTASELLQQDIFIN